MRVGIFRDGPFLPPHQGGSNSIYNMVNALVDKGVHVYLFRCFRGWDNPEWYKKEKFATIFIKPRDFYKNPKLVKHLIIKYKIQICHFDSAEATLIQGKFLKRISKICWEVHNVNHILISRLGGDDGTVDRSVRLERNASETADLLLVRSNKDKQDLVNIGVADQKIVLYRGSINCEEIKFKHGRNGKNIIFVGNLKYKPNENAVRMICKVIAPNVINTHPDVKFLIIGSSNLQLSRELANKNVVFLGEVDDLNKVYDIASIALCPVLEGSGTRLKILEYLAAGIPTISTNIGIEGLEKEIRKSLVIEDRLDRYPKLINKIITDPNKFDELVSWGRKYVIKNRCWKSTIQDIMMAYKNII